MEILLLEDLGGYSVVFGCKRSCSSARRVYNFKLNAPQGGIYPHIKCERDPLNILKIGGYRVVWL